MGQFALGKTFQMQDDPQNRFLVDAISAANLRSSIYSEFPELAKLRLEDILYRDDGNMRQQFVDLMRELDESRTSGGSKGKYDLFSVLIDAKDPETGEGFTLEELWSESKLLIGAGKELRYSSFREDGITNEICRLRHFFYGYDHCVFLPLAISRVLQEGHGRSSLYLQQCRRDCPRLKAILLHLPPSLHKRIYENITTSWRCSMERIRRYYNRWPLHTTRLRRRHFHVCHPPQRRILPRLIHIRSRAMDPL